MDGIIMNIDDLKEKFNTERTIILNYYGDLDKLRNGLKIKEKYDGRAVIEVDTYKISVSESIGYLSSKVNIIDVQVSTTTVEDVVVGLYKEYKI